MNSAGAVPLPYTQHEHQNTKEYFFTAKLALENNWLSIRKIRIFEGFLSIHNGVIENSDNRAFHHSIFGDIL